MATIRTPETKQERSVLSTSKLLDAAADLIAEVGYERMTLTAIGKRAGYSHGLVTARFGSKEGLLWALVERMVEVLDQDLAPSGENHTTTAGLDAMLATMRRSWSTRSSHMQALYGLMFEALLPIPLLNERMRDMHRRLRSDIEAALKRDLAAGVLPPGIDPQRTARLIVGALRGAVYQAMLDPDAIRIEDALDDVSSLVDRLLNHRG